jgi:hypothetical protein
MFAQTLLLASCWPVCVYSAVVGVALVLVRNMPTRKRPLVYEDERYCHDRRKDACQQLASAYVLVSRSFAEKLPLIKIRERINLFLNVTDELPMLDDTAEYSRHRRAERLSCDIFERCEETRNLAGSFRIGAPLICKCSTC